jgi:hypothetical protein
MQSLPLRDVATIIMTTPSGIEITCSSKKLTMDKINHQARPRRPECVITIQLS